MVIPLAHLHRDGNGAASRFYHKLFTEGYDGTPAADRQYEALLPSRGRQPEYREWQWQAAFAQYLAKDVGGRLDLPYIPAGYTLAPWHKDNGRFPVMQHQAGLYFVEWNFATPFDLAFMAETGRDLSNYLVEINERPYIDTEKLLLDVDANEITAAHEVDDTHKKAYLQAVNAHFATNDHPAFGDLDIAA